MHNPLLNPDENKLHGALLAYWDKLKDVRNPYVNKSGTRLVKITNGKNQSSISLNSETYFRLHRLEADIAAMLDEKNLEIPTRETLDKLMQFFDETGCCKISFNPMELPVLCRNIESMDGMVVELKELSSFLENKKEYRHISDCVSLPVLSHYINGLANAAKSINAGNLTGETKTMVTQLQLMDTDHSYQYKEIMFYMSTMLRIAYALACFFSNVIKTAVGIPAASYALNYLSKHKIEGYYPFMWPFFVVCQLIFCVNSLKLNLRNPLLSLLFESPHKLLSFIAINPYGIRVMGFSFDGGPIGFYVAYVLLVILALFATLLEQGALFEASFVNQSPNMRLVIRDRETGEQIDVNIHFMEDGTVRVEHETLQGVMESFVIEREAVAPNPNEFFRQIRNQAVIRFTQPPAVPSEQPVAQGVDVQNRNLL